MKLHHHPASTTSRPLLLFAAESGLTLDLQLADLFTGEHTRPPFAALNPSRLVPVLEDGDFRLTESAAILQYLADLGDLPLYPRDLRARARVHERMDWVNTQLCRDLAYGTVYPQIFPAHRRRSEEAQAAHLQWGLERSRAWLQVMDLHLLGENPWVCGARMTIADHFASAFVALAETVGSDFAAWPNVRHWLDRMKALPHWAPVYQVIDAYAASLKGQALLPI